MAQRNLRCHKQPIKRVTANVDWLTCTGKSRDSRNALWEIGERLLHRGQREGEDPTRWHGHGYDGWSGIGVSVGARPDSVILRLSSEQASNEWLHSLRAAENVSRLDLAVDVYFHLPVTVVARQLYRDASHVPSRNGRPISRTIIQDSHHGQTCYLGKRVSDEMGRVYDKGVESRTLPPGLRWRYEVEYKRESAWAHANGLARAESERPAISSIVAQWFGARGGRVWDEDSVPALCQWLPKEPSDTRKLHWLARGVRPTAVALVDSLGYDRVLTALGLQDAHRTPRKAPLN